MSAGTRIADARAGHEDGLAFEVHDRARDVTGELGTFGYRGTLETAAFTREVAR